MEQKTHGSPSFINIAVLLLFAIVIAVVSAVTTYFVLNSRSNEQYSADQPSFIPPSQTYVQPISPPIGTTTQTVPDETADWQTYSSKAHGFSINYPRNWKVKQDHPDNVFLYDQNNQLVIYIGTYLESATLRLSGQKIKLEDAIKPHEEVGYGNPQLTKIEYLNENKTNIYSEWNYISFNKVQSHLIKANFLKNIKEATYGPYYDLIELRLENNKYKTIYNQILSTFKFLE